VGWAGVVGPARKFAVRHVEKRTAKFFLCRAFQKTHGKECLCRAFFAKRTAKVFS
jgi:hypothetical protein